MEASYDDTFRTLVYTGRPLRIVKNKYAMEWEKYRKDEMKELLSQGIIPYTADVDVKTGRQKERSDQYAASYAPQEDPDLTPHLAGAVSGAIKDIKPAKQIVEEMIAEAIKVFQKNNARIVSKL